VGAGVGVGVGVGVTVGVGVLRNSVIGFALAAPDGVAMPKISQTILRVSGC
jgi:hypothetical protein